MKWLLILFTREFLIRMSLLFQPIINWYFKGTTFIDPIDGNGYRKFLSYGYDKLRENALSPGTFSLERHRLLWLYFERKTNLLNSKIKVLHVAPEQAFYKKFKNILSWDYITTDLHSPLADVKADLTNLPFEDNHFDLILCNHVLEHITDDHKAMSEIFRVLKKGGKAILQVPMDQNRPHTFEDFSITDPKERTKNFGQYDHVRIYGVDFFDRLEKVGFKTEKIDFTAELTREEIERFSLPKGEWIPLGIK